mgnify:CR=1 FL=1
MKPECMKKPEGWNTVDDVERKLGVRKSTAYFYLHKLDRSGHIAQKIRKPRGALYLISSTPIKYRHYGMYEDTGMVAPSQEFSKTKVSCEQKIAFFLKKYREENNTRYYIEAKKMVRKIKDWKLLYRFLKAYKSREEFKILYMDARLHVRKMPSMPKRYLKLLFVGV